MSKRSVSAVAAGTGVVLPAVIGALVNELHQGWPWWVAAVSVTSIAAALAADPLGLPLVPRSNDYGKVIDVAFAPGGKTLAVSNVDGTVRLWEVATHRMIGTLHGALGNSPAPSTRLAFGRDGTTLVTANQGLARSWDLRKMAQAGPAFRVGWPVPGVTVFSADGTTTATNGVGAIDLWNLSSRTQVGVSLKTNAAGMAFSPDGKLLAAIDGADSIALWDLASETRAGSDTVTGANFERLAYGPDGASLVAAGSLEGIGSLFWWRLGAARLTPAASTPSNCTGPLALGPGGRTLAVGCGGLGVQLWDADEHNPLDGYLHGENARPTALAFNADGSVLAVGYDNGWVRLWQVRYGS